MGEIRDEFDTEEKPLPSQHGPTTFDGKVILEQFAEATGLQLEGGRYAPIAGYVMARLGRVPAVGDSRRGSGFRLAVIEMKRMRVTRLQFTAERTGLKRGWRREAAELSPRPHCGESPDPRPSRPAVRIAIRPVRPNIRASPAMADSSIGLATRWRDPRNEAGFA